MPWPEFPIHQVDLSFSLHLVGQFFGGLSFSGSEV